MADLKISTFSTKFREPKLGTAAVQLEGNHDKRVDHVDIYYECDSCKVEGNHVRATSLCVQCKKAMCMDCKQIHQTADMTWQHIFVHGKDMHNHLNGYFPGSTHDHCHKHRYRVLELYCKRHSDILCAECKDTHHADCWDIIDLDLAAKGMKGEKELPQTIIETRKLLKNFEKLESMTVEQIKKLKDQRFACLHTLQNFRKEIDTILNILESSLRADIETRLDKDIDDLDEIKSVCEKKLAELRSECKALDVAKSTDDIQSFITMVKTKKKLTEWESVLTHVEKEHKETKFIFEPNYKLLDNLKDTENVGLGCLKVTFRWPKNMRALDTQIPESKGTLNDTSKHIVGLSKVGEYNICSSSDLKSSCSVAGSTFLSDGKLLLCDLRNQKLKLFDQDFQLKSTFTLPSSPYDVTMLTNRDAVVSLPELKELHYVILDPGCVFRRSRVVHTATACQGVCAHKDGLLVTCYNHGVFGIMLLLDLEGRVKRRFERAPPGEAVFQGPFLIAQDRYRDRYYVSDKATDTVVALTLGGKVIFRYWSYLSYILSSTANTTLHSNLSN